MCTECRKKMKGIFLSVSPHYREDIMKSECLKLPLHIRFSSPMCYKGLLSCGTPV